MHAYYILGGDDVGGGGGEMMMFLISRDDNKLDLFLVVMHTTVTIAYRREITNFCIIIFLSSSFFVFSLSGKVD